MTNPDELAAVRVSVESGLACPGDSVSVRDTIALGSFTQAGREFVLHDGLEYDIVLTNTGEGVLATGMVRGTATVPCDRCLEDATVDIAAEVSCYYLHDMPEDGDDDEDFGLIDPLDGTVDLTDAIRSAVSMDIPFVILCDDGCKGLCPVCGANLNEGDCGCNREPDPDFAKRNPFAVLAGLKFDEAPGDAEGDEIEDCDDEELDDDEFERAWEERRGGPEGI